MVSTPKIIGLVSCGFLLCLGLSNPAQAEDAAPAVEGNKADAPHMRQKDGPRVGGQGGQPAEGQSLKGAADKPHTRMPGGQRVGGQGGKPDAVPGVDGKKAAAPHTRMPGGTRVGGQGGQ